MDIVLGYFGAFFVGLALSLVGGGGSILLVPILVYGFHIDPIIATTYSLFLVGISSAFGSISAIYKKMVYWPSVLVFGFPSIVAVYLVRYYLLPAIPNFNFYLGTFVITKSVSLLLLLAVLMMFSAWSMIRACEKCNDEADDKLINFKYSVIIIEGFVIGGITGLVGAGGGFIIIPALVLLANMPMKKAIGTSLVLITLKSLIGFLGDFNTNIVIEWTFLFKFFLVSIVGILLGNFISDKMPIKNLRPLFGYFVLAMGIFIVIKEFTK